MARAKSEFPTMNELLSKVVAGKVTKGHGVRYVTSGRKAKSFPRSAKGLVTLDPGQLLSVRIPVQRVREGAIRGYQQAFKAQKAREIGQYILGNPNYLMELPVVEISLDDDGNHLFPFATDGQHRIAGAIIANRPIRAVVTDRSSDEARRLFANQAKATKPNRNVLILDSDDVYAEYIQDAVTNPQHPWNALISAGQKGSHTKMSATSAYGMLLTYVGMRAGVKAIAPVSAVEAFDKAKADELADLVKCFGTPQTNRLAFSGIGLRAIASAARIVFRENQPAETDRDRWMRHMPRFDFAQYSYIRSSVQLSEQMIRWWNRNLSNDRKIKLT